MSLKAEWHATSGILSLDRLSTLFSLRSVRGLSPTRKSRKTPPTSALADHGGGQLAATSQDLPQWKIRGSGVVLEPFSRDRFTGTHAMRNGQAGFHRQREQNEM
jgi:hypothetical protein